jgi:hypothetical protein
VSTSVALGVPAEIALASWVRRAWRRVTPRTLGWLALFVVAWDAAGETFFAPEVDRPANLSLMILACAVAGVAAVAPLVMIADEAVADGKSPWLCYPAALVAGLVMTVLLAEVANVLLGMCPDDPLIKSGSPWWEKLESAITWFLSFAADATGVLLVYVNLRAAYRADQRRHEAELARTHARRRTLEARLQAMQARVEPQFLFNTLAQVKRLYELDPVLAERMLDDLIGYLRAAMPHMRDTASTVAQEVELARRYLDIVKLRLGERLEVEIDMPGETTACRMPPMVLLPLIDHAIVHGLGPPRASGKLRIACEALGGKLRVLVADSGAGFVPGSQADGLASIQQRLAALYGVEGKLELQQGPGEQTHALMEIPLEEPREFAADADTERAAVSRDRPAAHAAA